MKKILKNIKYLAVAAAFGVGFTSCDNEDYLVITPTEPEEALVFTNTIESEYLLSEQTSSNVAERFVWSAADFDAPTPVNYTLEGSVNVDFSTVDYSSGTIDATNQAVMVSDLLDMAEVLGLDSDPETTTEDGMPNTMGEVYFRVVAFVGDAGAVNGVNQTSDVSSMNITMLEALEDIVPELPRLAVPGDHQAWNPDETVADYVPYLASSEEGATDYEGFVYLNNQFKFVAPNEEGLFVWGNLDYGDAIQPKADGSYTGILTADDESNIGTASTGGPGYYYIKADTEALTYSIEMTNWAVTGDATALGWPAGPDGTEGQDVDMVYDDETKTWSVTLDLDAKDIKFRANDAWTLNIGDNDADGSLEFNGANIAIQEAGNYTITLDLSNPRAYTYSVVKN